MNKTDIASVKVILSCALMGSFLIAASQRSFKTPESQLVLVSSACVVLLVFWLVMAISKCSG